MSHMAWHVWVFIRLLKLWGYLILILNKLLVNKLREVVSCLIPTLMRSGINVELGNQSSLPYKYTQFPLALCALSGSSEINWFMVFGFSKKN